VNSLAFSKRGDRLISGSEDGTVKVFDPRTGLEAIGLKLPERTPVYRIQISPDEHRIIIMGKTKGAFIFDGTPQK
jgi:WD40 repeat protein